MPWVAELWYTCLLLTLVQPLVLRVPEKSCEDTWRVLPSANALAGGRVSAAGLMGPELVCPEQRLLSAWSR